MTTRLGEVRGWIDELLPAADSLEPDTQAELLWTAATTALFAAGVRLNRQQAIAAARLAQTSPAAGQTSDYQRLQEQPP